MIFNDYLATVPSQTESIQVRSLPETNAVLQTTAELVLFYTENSMCSRHYNGLYASCFQLECKHELFVWHRLRVAASDVFNSLLSPEWNDSS